jgi:intracellular sulfur oxidation DsrE/DsrF family protein
MMKKTLFVTMMLGLTLAGINPVLAGVDCPNDNVPNLDTEFGPGTIGKTTCLSDTTDIKIVMQLNKSCRDSYATHPVGTNGKPTGDVSKVVNNVANCTRPYALGNLGNMYNDYITTNGIDAEEIDMKVIVHSGGGFLLLKDEGYDGNGNPITGRNKFQTNVEVLMDMGVKFYFCQNTTRGFIKKGILPDSTETAGGATAELIDGVEYVTAGVTAIADLQEQGYKYVQP